jgi:transcriptional regulator with XRE-family HTH domain
VFDKKNFGERLRALRTDGGVPQTTIASLLGVTRTQISDIENGKTTTSMERVAQLADYFRVTTDYLLGRVENQRAMHFDFDNFEYAPAGVPVETGFTIKGVDLAKTVENMDATNLSYDRKAMAELLESAKDNPDATIHFQIGVPPEEEPWPFIGLTPENRTKALDYIKLLRDSQGRIDNP